MGVCQVRARRVLPWQRRTETTVLQCSSCSASGREEYGMALWDKKPYEREREREGERERDGEKNRMREGETEEK